MVADIHNHKYLWGKKLCQQLVLSMLKSAEFACRVGLCEP